MNNKKYIEIFVYFRSYPHTHTLDMALFQVKSTIKNAAGKQFYDQYRVLFIHGDRCLISDGI